MPPATRHQAFSMFKGVILGFACYAAYAWSDAFVKSLEGTLPAYEAVFFGAVLALLALPFLKKPGDRWSEIVVGKMPGLWLLRAMAGAIGNVTAVMAFTALPMAEAFCLIFLLPIFVTILSVIFLREHVGWRRWSAVVVGFLGVLVVLRPGFRHLGTGHVAAIICGITGALSIIALRMAGASEKRITLYGAGVIGPMIAGFIMMLPHFVWPDLHQWFLVLGYGLFAAAGAVLLMLATQVAPAARVAPTQYSQMLWAILFGYLIFHDHLDWPMLVGIVMILGAGLFTFVREEKKTDWWRWTNIV